ncbi:MAG: secretin N-terminal domain-containing protein [Candidatus Omnitrophica bacterium]|nr:secretin N-terminal domain-containing protein [Candidatus Omnitrophota bacterium]
MKNKLLLMLVLIFFVSAVYAQDEQNGVEEKNKPFAAPMETIERSVVVSNKITLDVKGMDVVDVLKIISARSGMNIVIGKNVVGRVTLFLKDVEINDVFEIVISANDLAYEKKGQIVNVMTQRDYELLYGESFQNKKQAKIIHLKYSKAVDSAVALTQLKSDLGKVVVDQGSNTVILIDGPEKVKAMEDFIKSTDQPLKTKIFNLNYALADKLNPKLQEVITKGVGLIRFDERTNKIAVTDYPAKLAEIEEIVKAFDEKTAQVLIDAQIIEITPSDQFKMGVDWNFWIQKYFDVKMGFPINTTGALILGTANSTPTKKGQSQAIIDILRTIGDTKILSSPRVMALNNQEAKILVGTKEAYVTQSISQSGTGTEITADQVNFVDVGIKLYVTPAINKDNFVTMKIKPEISSSEYKDFGTATAHNYVPIVTTSESETTVTVKDGITVIIAGLRKDKRIKTVKQVPILGDIPLLGYFFRSIDDKLEKSDLVILLTPHIMSGETSYSDFSEIKPKDGAVAKMVKGKVIISKVSTDSEETAMAALGPDSAWLREYSLIVIDKINRFSKLNLPKEGKGEVFLSFTVSRQGDLVDEPKILNTADPSLASWAVKAVKDSSPFPLLPKNFDKSRETFRIILSYE